MMNEEGGCWCLWEVFSVKGSEKRRTGQLPQRHSILPIFYPKPFTSFQWVSFQVQDFSVKGSENWRPSRSRHGTPSSKSFTPNLLPAFRG